MSRSARFEVIPHSPASEFHAAITLRDAYDQPRGAVMVIRAFDSEGTEVPGAAKGWPVSRIIGGNAVYIPTGAPGDIVSLPMHTLTGYATTFLVEIRGFQDKSFDPALVSDVAVMPLPQGGKRAIISSYVPQEVVDSE